MIEVEQRGLDLRGRCNGLEGEGRILLEEDPMLNYLMHAVYPDGEPANAALELSTNVFLLVVQAFFALQKPVSGTFSS